MFWIHGDDLPAGAGSEPFCPMHLAYLAVFLAATVCYALRYKKMDGDRRRRADRVLSAAVLFFCLCEYGVTALLGHFSRYTLPLHVCTLLFLLAPVHAWTGDARPGSAAAGLHALLGAALFHPGLLGTWAALLFPDWLYVPFWNYLSVSSFLAHGLLSAYGASVLVRIGEAADRSGDLRRDLRGSLLFMAVGAALMYLFDRATGTNYWFMAGPGNGSPFAGAYARGGYGGYLLAYSLTAVVVTALWYGLRHLLVVRRGRA
ncbi:MAG: YwaF family protein [Oscillospiraceae bacterium]|nr:YwaF family protein [Oscillospiraceae bacterium]